MPVNLPTYMFWNYPNNQQLNTFSRPVINTFGNPASVLDNPPDGWRVGGAGRKGDGWLGRLNRPDGNYSTELSAQFSDVLGGAPIPLLVPTLTKDEINVLLGLKESDQIPRSIINKAIEHALMRDKLGLSPFKD